MDIEKVGAIAIAAARVFYGEEKLDLAAANFY